MAASRLHEHYCPTHLNYWEHHTTIRECVLKDIAVCPTCIPVKVINLRTLDEQVFVGIRPEEAVIAAYAQDKGDNNTWDYERRYSGRVRWTSRTVFCGDFTAKIEK